MRQHNEDRTMNEGGLLHPEAFAGIVTANASMFEMMRHAESVAASPGPLLLTGETGVGKELMARALHRLSGRKGPLVAVNVAGLDENVFADTLFGHQKGAFTGAERLRHGQVEKARGGTLFLDEIGDLAPTSQVKLLRLLQEGEFFPLGSDDPHYTDCRIIAATNVDLWHRQRAGTFRKDLNFRLRTHHIHIPPLRERIDDVPLLVHHFLRAMGGATPWVPEQVLRLLAAYNFPGNVRELQGMMQDAVTRLQDGSLDVEIFKAHVAMVGDRTSADSSVPAEGAEFRFPARLPSLKQACAMLVREAMKRAAGNQTAAASMLGITRQALSKRLKNLQD